MSAISEEVQSTRVSVFNDPRMRSIVAQAVFVALLVWAGYEIVANTATNLARLNKTIDFGFLNSTAGFDIIQSMIDYTRESSYGRAIFVGFLNTLMVAGLGIFFATILGFIIGVMRLSPNWVIRKIGTLYVELVRNIPLLLQIFFWYAAVLKPLPGPKQAINFLDMVFISNRGVMVPKPMWESGAGATGIAFLVGCVATFFVLRWAKRRQEATGEQFPRFLASLGLILGLPLAALIVTGFPVTFDYPQLKGFNFVGGITMIPEFMALLLALSIYTASFIAEIVRAGILAVSHGQTEAASALGLRAQPTLRLVVVPQALRVIIPPLTSQYLNLTKNSSLAVAIAYPDLVAMGGTVLNQSGHAVEVFLIWMVVYLTVSLVYLGIDELVQCARAPGGALAVSSAANEIAWVRHEEAPQLPAPANMAGVVGWARKNLFSSIGNTILTFLGIAFIVWFAWGTVVWALFRATFFGDNREACVVGQAEGKALGACWPYVYAKFHQFIYGFYPFAERWRVNICFVVGIIALVPMLIPSVPYKKWNVLFLLIVYPLMTFILLTGGNLDISSAVRIALIGLLLLSTILVPIIAFGIEGGVQRNVFGLGLAGLAILAWVVSLFVETPEMLLLGVYVSVATIVILLLLAVSAAMSIISVISAADTSSRAAIVTWAGIWCAIIAALVLVSIDFGLVPVETQQWGGLLVTLVVAVTGIVASLPLGILLALGRRSKLPIVRLFSIIFIEVWRGVPLITVLFMASIMLPLFMPEGTNFDKLLRALVGTALFSAAYMAETVRGGLQAIPMGQYEAAKALGLSYWKMMSLIVLPQALKIVIPGIVNSFISLFKDTTLVAIIGLFDLLGIVNAGFADPKWASPQTAQTGYFVAAMIFWAFCFGMSRYSIFMERRLATGHKR